MPRFFSTQIDGDKIIIGGDDAKHIGRVLRMRIGDSITVSDTRGTDYSCTISSIGDEAVLTVVSSAKNETEPSVPITLYQALPKSDKLEFIIQKAIELGACKIVPIVTKFCVAKLSPEDFAKKLSRYNKIALEAAKQSGRGIIPTVESILTLEQAISSAKGKKILYYEHGGKKTSQLVDLNDKEISIFVGSEGGFDAQEVQRAIEHGCHIGTLGSRILRCETAPLTGLCLVLHELGEM